MKKVIINNKKEAKAYLLKVLKWKKFIQHHKGIKQSIKILCGVENEER